jgi:hypothetical protein
MKKLLLCLIIFTCITGASLFAWEPEDLKKYPACIEKGPMQLNLGIGFGAFPKTTNGYYWIPPVRLSLDGNLPIGDNKLPFFLGGLIGFTGYGYNGDYYDHYFYGAIPVGARFGYHFNWGVDQLDTYAVATAGWQIPIGDNDWRPSSWFGLLWGAGIGARWFVSDGFGFWIELGGGSFTNFDIGFAFKF